MKFPLLLVTLSVVAIAQTPRFSDATRKEKLKAALPEIEKIFQRYHEGRKVTGSAWGITNRSSQQSSVAGSGQLLVLVPPCAVVGMPALVK